MRDGETKDPIRLKKPPDNLQSRITSLHERVTKSASSDYRVVIEILVVHLAF